MEETLKEIKDELTAIRLIITRDVVMVGEKQKVADDETLEDCGLSYRLYNTLRAFGVNTVGELKEHSLVEIRKVRNIGNKSLNELKAFVDENKIRMR